MDQWSELATHWGIEQSYYDVHGRRRDADPEIIRRVAAALSLPGNPPPPHFDVEGPPPQLAFQGDGRRSWVLAVQLYGVRSRSNWGHGDFTDLAHLLETVADLGGAGVGLNPLHCLFYDRPCAYSPYSPNSRLFFNPLYIDVEAVEEFRGGDAASAAEIDRLRATALVEYDAVARVKLAALRQAYVSFRQHGSDTRRQDFGAYRQERGRALQYFAAFETLRGQHAGPWWTWPKAWRQATDRAIGELHEHYGDELGFHEFLQWNAERQLRRCSDIARRRGLAIGLYLDTAVGVDAGGADAWIDQTAVLRGLSVGAPPDQYNTAGQDWGLTAYNPHGLVASDFGPFRQMLGIAMKYAGAIRVDHVLGLNRLYVIPQGLKADQGVYLRMPFAQMLAEAADESRRFGCVTIGEDLGTVPAGLRETLSAWGIWSYLVMLFERNADGSFRRPAEYRDRAVATFSTHDLPTFAGWMNGHDLAIRRSIGVDPGETDEERQNARTALQTAVTSITGKVQIGYADMVAFLAASPSRLISIGIEDVLDVADQCNVPGTVAQHPNWRRRWPIELEKLSGDHRLGRIAAALARAGRASTSVP
jgi:4-alpha-glucanotransferase